MSKRKSKLALGKTLLALGAMTGAWWYANKAGWLNEAKKYFTPKR